LLSCFAIVRRASISPSFCRMLTIAVAQRLPGSHVLMILRMRC
jgi:hypothetical protein